MNMGISVVGWVIFEDIEITWVISGLRLEKKTMLSDKILNDRLGVTSNSGDNIRKAHEGSNCLTVIKWVERKR